MIGFINVCHEDYITDSALNIADRAVAELERNDINVYQIKTPVTDSIIAEKYGKELVKNEVDGVIIFLGTWIESPVAMSVIREIEHLPMCLWGFPMFKENNVKSSTGSYVSYAVIKGSMDRVGYRYKPVLGLPDTSSAVNDVVCFCKAADCSQRMKRSKIGLIGYASMGMYTGTFDHLFLRTKIGPEVEHIDSYTLINKAEAVEEERCQDAIEYLKSIAKIRDDVSRDDLIKVSKLFIALKDLSEQRRLSAVNVKCQYEFSKEYKMVMCVPLSTLAEFGVVSSCEGDILNTVSMMILSLLSGKAVTYGDVIDHGGNVVKISSCGFVPYSFGEAGKMEIRRFMPGVGFNGIQNSFPIRPGRVTVMRLVEDRCDYHMIYATGEGLDTELRQGYMPALDVRLDGSIQKFVDNYTGQHYAVCYGDLSKEIEDLGKILGINVTDI